MTVPEIQNDSCFTRDQGHFDQFNLYFAKNQGNFTLPKPPIFMIMRTRFMLHETITTLIKSMTPSLTILRTILNFIPISQEFLLEICLISIYQGHFCSKTPLILWTNFVTGNSEDSAWKIPLLEPTCIPNVNAEWTHRGSWSLLYLGQ